MKFEKGTWYPFMAQVALFIAVAGTDALYFHSSENPDQRLINMGLLIIATIAKEVTFRDVAPDFLKAPLPTAVRAAIDAATIVISWLHPSATLGFTAVRALSTITNAQASERLDPPK